MAAIWHGGPRLMADSVGLASTCFPPSDSGSDWWVGPMVWTTARTTCSNGAFPKSDGLATWSRIASHSTHVVDVARVVVVGRDAQSTGAKWLGDAMWWLPTKTALRLAGL
jgi:hypothetical protein